MNETFTPLLTTTDWNEEWKRLQTARQAVDDVSVWDEKARTFPVKHGSHEGYAGRFIELAGARPGETVLDMGCGTGALATPLAQAGCHVVACDFSSGMLAKMHEDQRALGVEGVESRQMSWADDWRSFGLGQNSVDVAIASRSIATADLGDSLAKLDAVARRRACITLPAGPSPRCDERLLEAVGVEYGVGRDFLYAFNILASRGVYPEVAYIVSPRAEFFDSFDDALRSYARIVADATAGRVSPEEAAEFPGRLRSWLEGNLVQGDCGWHLADERIVTWAFVAWQTGKLS